MNSSTAEQVAAIVQRVRTDVLRMARATAADEHLDLIEMPAEIWDVDAPQAARLYPVRNLDALAEGRELTPDELVGAWHRGTRRAQEEYVAAVPLGHQLSRPGAGRDHVMQLLDPLVSTPELLETLQTLLDRDGDRGRTARALGVHPNTVNNRLARIRDLLGIDPVSTHGIVTLSTALTARRLNKEDE